MSTAYPYRVEGASASFDSAINGYSFTVTIILDEVLGTNDVEQMYNALTDGNIPLIGSDLSGVSLDLTGCWLRKIDCLPIGDQQTRMTLVYQQSPFEQVQVSTQTQVSEVQSNKNRFGSAVNLRYLYPSNYGGETPTAREEELRGTYSGVQGGVFSVLVPESTRTYTVRQGIDGDQIARQYIGTVNDSLWQGGEAGTWMLSSVTGATDDSQQSPLNWVNSYTFQYKSDGWNPEIVYIDANTNEPVPDPEWEYPLIPAPEDPDIGSRTVVDYYESSDFTDLFPAVDP